MTAKSKKWKGELDKPIPEFLVPRSHGYVVDESTVAAENASFQLALDSAIAKARLAKLPLLFEHYGIDDKSDFLSLALALANEFVPGFSVKHVPLRLEHETYGAVVPAFRTGRPKEWTGARLRALLAAVEDVKKSKALATDREALQFLSRRAPWKAPSNHRGDNKQWIETLEARLQNAKKIHRGALQLSDMLLKIKDKFEEANSGNS